MYPSLRRMRGWAIAAVAALGVAGLQASSAQAATHYYQDLTSRATGTVANVGFDDGSKDPGEPVRLWVDEGPADWNSQWEEIPEYNSGWRALKNRWSGLCMDVAGTYNGAAVFQAPCDNTRSQKWRSNYALSGYSTYWGAWQNKWADHVGKPNQVLTINDMSDPTSPLVLWNWYGGHDQQWHYETEAHS